LVNEEIVPPKFLNFPKCSGEILNLWTPIRKEIESLECSLLFFL